MLDSTQILLISVISILTILLVVMGFVVVQILKEFLKSVKKINLILDDGHKITSSVAQPIEDASDLLHGIKKGASLIKNIVKMAGEEKIIKKFKNRKSGDGQSSESSDHEPSERKKHFFLKSGKSLN